MTGKDTNDADAEELLTTGDMARLGNSTLRTIRFYESQGLIKSAARCEGSHRRFERCELTKLMAVTGLRDAGLSLEEIGELIELKAGIDCPQQASTRVQGALTHQRQRLEMRIATLQRLRDEVDRALDEMSHCRECQCPDFPRDCADCEHVGPGGTTGLTRLVWKN
jgi:MerR family copper efflux transcriptional regulator